MIRRRGLGKPTKAMACVAAKVLAMRPLAEVAARRDFASYQTLRRGVEASSKCLCGVQSSRPSNIPMQT